MRKDLISTPILAYLGIVSLTYGFLLMRAMQLDYYFPIQVFMTSILLISAGIIFFAALAVIILNLQKQVKISASGAAFGLLTAGYVLFQLNNAAEVFKRLNPVQLSSLESFLFGQISFFLVAFSAFALFVISSPRDRVKKELVVMGGISMGLFDKFKDVSKLAAKKVAEKADETARKIKYKQVEKNIKRTLLSRFSMSQLEGICRARGISLQVEGKRGKRKARSKEELIPKLLKLNIDEIVRLAKRYGIKYQDLLTELEEARKELLEREEEYSEVDISVEPTETSILDEVLDIIQEEFRPESIRDEEDFEKQLTIFLKLKLGEERVERQKQRGGKRVDILIDGVYGLELKIADTPQTLAMLPTQLKIYSKRLEDVAAVIAVPNDVEIDDEVLEILEEEGFKYVLLQADVRR
jgi:hypothetical protein